MIHGKNFVDQPINGLNIIEYKVYFSFCWYEMTQYNSLNVKLSHSQLNKFESAIKNETEVVLRLSSNMTGDR